MASGGDFAIHGGAQNLGISVTPNSMHVTKRVKKEDEIRIMKALADACQKHNGCLNLIEMIEGKFSHDVCSLKMPAYELGSLQHCFRWDRHHILVANMEHIGDDTLSALNSLQKISWVHRDIKPDNIFLSFKMCKEGLNRVCAVLGDFGLATPEKKMHKLAGTQRYLPHARLHNPYKKMPTEHRTDRYAWVLTMYEVMYGGKINFHPFSNPVTRERREEKRPTFVTEFLKGESLYRWYPEDDDEVSHYLSRGIQEDPYRLLRTFVNGHYRTKNDGRSAPLFWETTTKQKQKRKLSSQEESGSPSQEAQRELAYHNCFHTP